MASDRFVYFPEIVPTVVELRALVEDYLGDLLDSITFEHSRFTVMLKSHDSFAFQRQERVTSVLRDAAVHCTKHGDQRGFEIFVHERSAVTDEPAIDIITRHADEFTNALAHDMMRICARLWNGRLDIDQITWMREEAMRFECSGDRKRRDAIDRLSAALHAKNWDDKAIDLLVQLVRARG